jgi:uncharacterized membrane protein YhaH (DUF805 family)
MTNKSQPISFSQIIFWILWSILLLVIPIYGFTFLFELEAVRSGNALSYLSPVIGVAVFLAQLLVIVRSFQQGKKVILISKAYLTLLGGTVIIGLIWAGDCASMGPLRF